MYSERFLYVFKNIDEKSYNEITEIFEVGLAVSLINKRYSTDMTTSIFEKN